MSNGLPTKANVGVRGKSVDIDTQTYFIAKRMETAGMLRPGQAMMLAAVLPNKQAKTAKKGKNR